MRTDQFGHSNVIPLQAVSRKAGFPPLDLFFGRSAAMLAVRRNIECVSRTDVPILLQGASGTGKDLCAQLLHGGSLRSPFPVVKVSCPAIPTALLESELFGYEKGAFTGANQTKKGRVEQAHRGTLLLDEVSCLEPLMQAKLLQVVQDGTFLRVGGHEERTISTRLISIASDDLQVQVNQGDFRLDLLHRINAVTIKLPPLRERLDDLPELIAYFCHQHAAKHRLPIRRFSNGLLQLMRSYSWPGNIRQLDNLIQRFTLMGDEDLIAAELIPNAPAVDEITTEIDFSKPLSLKEITKQAKLDIERQIILKVLKGNGWNRRKTAAQLQISYRSLLYKLDEGQSAVASAPSRPAPTRNPPARFTASPLGTGLEVGTSPRGKLA